MKIKSAVKRITLVLLIMPLAILITGFSYNIAYWGRVFPGISVAGIDVGGQKPSEVIDLLASNVKVPEKIILTSSDQAFELPLEEINLSHNYSETANSAYYLFRTGNILYDFYNKLSALFHKRNIGLRLDYDRLLLDKNLSVIAGQVAIEPTYPSLKYTQGNIIIGKGSAGTDTDSQELRLLIGQALSLAKDTAITIPIKTIDPTLTELQVVELEKRAQMFIGEKIIVSFEESEFIYKESDIFSLVDPVKGFDKEKITNLSEKIAKEIDRQPQNAIFLFQQGKVKEFAPAKDGLRVEQDQLANQFLSALETLQVSDQLSFLIDIPVKKTQPAITTQNVNNLGINELLAKGLSRFAGSIASRIHNIDLAASKFNGVLVKPGEVFSFNDTLGDVSLFTGYQQAYIIKDGKTVLGDGGGVCQVSTTLFRAIIDAGLPIVERRAHSYRVAYYEQGFSPGFDATVYAPTTDLKFKNDTPGHLLIQTQFNRYTATLVFEIYGTSDGRVSKTTKPIVTDVVPPPEDLYVDDPTLPTGQIKQIDWKAWGAKVNFKYFVEKDGETVYQKTFYSNYRPWQAIFLRGTGPAI